LTDLARTRRPPNRLTSVEQRIVEAACSGTEMRFGDQLPTASQVETSIPGESIVNAIRAAGKEFRGLRLFGAIISGDIDLSYAELRGSLSIVNCRVSGDVSLEHCHVQGAVSFEGSHVQRFQAGSAFIEGVLRLNKGFTVANGVRAIGLRVTGSMSLANSHITAPINNSALMAVEMYRAQIGDLFFNRATIDGGVFAVGISVARNIRLQGMTVQTRKAMQWPSTAESDASVSLAGAHIGASIYLSSAKDATLKQYFSHPIDLTSVTCQRLFVRPEVLEDPGVVLDDFTYDALRLVGLAEFGKALRGSPSDNLQPLSFFASHCAERGEDSLRTQAMMAIQERRRKTLPKWSRQRLVRNLLKGLVGFGYRPLLSVFWLLLVVVLCTVLVHFHNEFLQPVAKAGILSVEPHLLTKSWQDSAVLAADNLLPFAGLGSRDRWLSHANSNIALFWLTTFLILKFCAWALAALGIASVTGLIRNK
jgi:hypothetical protein